MLSTSIGVNSVVCFAGCAGTDLLPFDGVSGLIGLLPMFEGGSADGGG